MVLAGGYPMVHIIKQVHRPAASGQHSLVRLLALCSSGLLFVFSSLAHAQPTPITPSGLHTQVSDPISVGAHTQYDITGGTRPGGGVNLFHSFGDFNVPTSNIANFLNSGSVDLNGTLLLPNLPTTNILGRVTEQQTPSIIFGMIQTNGTGGFDHANLFLMNPHGFLFGPNAMVNVGGLVAFTSVDYLRLADGVRFNAIPDMATDALLTASPVAAFGFLGSNPGTITVQGSQLAVTDGHSISLIGGNISIESGTPDGGTAQPARLSAPKGQIQLASAASPGEFDATTLQALPNVDRASFTSFGSVTLAAGSNINVSGANTVSIRGGQFVLSVNDAVLTTSQTAGLPEAISLSRGSSIVTSNSGAGPGADVQLIASSVQMDGASIISTIMGDGPGGNISIANAQIANLTNGAQIVSTTTGAGDGGSITISTTNSPTDSVTISGFDSDGTLSGVSPLGIVTSGVFSTASAGGNGGQISITASTVTLDNGGTLATITSGAGRGGDLTLKVGNLNIQNGGLMLSSAGTGRGGDNTVVAEDSIQVSQFNPNFGFTGGILSQSNDVGDGGNITLSARSVSIENGGVINSVGAGPGNAGNIAIAAEQVLVSGVDDSENSSQISSSNPASNSGMITITAQSVNVADRGLLQTDGTGGNITIQAAQSMNVTGMGRIESIGVDTGPSGDITISADQVLISGQDEFTGSHIETVSHGQAETGKINLNVRELVVTDGGRINTENTVSSSALGGIHIAATESVTVSDEGKIRMENVAGPAGPIAIDAPTITLDQGIIQTESLSGNSGSVTLHADSLSLAGGFINTRVTQAVPGRGGDITINVTGKVSVSGHFNGNAVGDNPRPAGIYADTFGTLQGGDISVIAGNLISISGMGAGLYSQTLGSSGNGGAISIQAPQVQLSNGAIVTASSTGAGAGGSITIGAGNTFTSNASTVSSTAIQATGGDINVTAGQSVMLTNGSSISASSTGPGNAGNISIDAGNQLTLRNSSITTEASQASGGNIDIQARIQVRLVDATISTSVHGGAGSGGNITIDPLIMAMQNSQIIAQAVQGAGGNITISTPLFLADQTSFVSASSQFGLNGTVRIQSPTSNLSGTVGSLPSSISQQQALQAQRCAAASGGGASSFIIAGRDTIPTEPGSWLAQPLGLGINQDLLAEISIDEPQPTMLAMAQTSETIPLRRLTPAGFLTQRFAGNGSDGCRS